MILKRHTGNTYIYMCIYLNIYIYIYMDAYFKVYLLNELNVFTGI